MKNKRILYAASSVSHIERFHLDYINALRNFGARVDVVARGGDIDIPFEKRIFSTKNPACIFKIRKLLKHTHYDAVILNTALAAFIVRAAYGRKRPKTLYIVHGFLFGERIKSLNEALFLFAELLLKNRTDTLLVMNSEDLRIAKKWQLCRIILNSRGMGCRIKDVITSPEHIRREFFGDGRFVMCFVGELSVRKNQRFLIEALPLIAEKIPNILLCLVGDGKEREKLTALSRSLEVTDKILLVGEREDASDFVRAADLYVSASASEGLPFNLLEALALGKTIIVSNVKGHRDIMCKHSNFLFEFGNLQDFVNKTCQFYKKSLVLSEKDAKQIYTAYSKKSVLPETLKKIREAIE